jgi:hypothetical protein
MSDRDHKHLFYPRTVDDCVWEAPQQVLLSILLHVRPALWTRRDLFHGAIHLIHESRTSVSASSVVPAPCLGRLRDR